MEITQKDLIDKFNDYDKKLQKLEENLTKFRDLELLTSEGDKIMDAITKYVIGQGFNDKIRELRSEFLAIQDFKTAEAKYPTFNDLARIQKDITAQTHAIKSQLNALNEGGKSIENGVTEVREVLDSFATKQDFEEIMYALQSKTSIDTTDKLEELIQSEYFRNEFAENLKLEIYEQFTDLQQQVDLKANIKDTQKQESNLKNLIDKNYEKTSLIKNCQRDKQELQKLIDKQQAEIDKIKKYLKKIDKKLEEHQESIEQKVEIKSFIKIKELVLKLPTWEDTNNLKNFVITNIERFDNDNLAFHQDFKTQNEIIRRYDEVLSQKVSQIQMNEEYAKINALISFNIKEVLKEIEDTNYKISNSNLEFQKYQIQILKEIDFRINAEIKKERIRNLTHQQSQAVSNEASNFEGINTLKLMLQMKADKTELDKLYEQKTNKIDFENILDIQEIMSKQFKHIVVLFTEMLNCQQMKVNESKQAYDKRLLNLVRQLHSFTNWVLNFDPLNFINSTDAANLQIMDYMEESQFKNFTNIVLKDLKQSKTSSVGNSGPVQMSKQLNKKLSKNQSISVSCDFNYLNILQNRQPFNYQSLRSSYQTDFDHSISQSKSLTNQEILNTSPSTFGKNIESKQLFEKNRLNKLNLQDIQNQLNQTYQVQINGQKPIISERFSSQQKISDYTQAIVNIGVHSGRQNQDQFYNQKLNQSIIENQKSVLTPKILDKSIFQASGNILQANMTQYNKESQKFRKGQAQNIVNLLGRNIVEQNFLIQQQRQSKIQNRKDLKNAMIDNDSSKDMLAELENMERLNHQDLLPMINFTGNRDKEIFSVKNSESSIEKDNFQMKAINKSSFNDVGIRQNSHDEFNQNGSFVDQNSFINNQNIQDATNIQKNENGNTRGSTAQFGSQTQRNFKNGQSKKDKLRKSRQFNNQEKNQETEINKQNEKD